MNLVKLLFVLIGVGFLLSVTGRAQSPVTVTIANSPGYAIPDDFAGLSFEPNTLKPDHAGVSGYIFSPTNSEVVTLFRNMGLHNLRIGGSSGDGTNAAHPTATAIANLFGFAQAAGLKVIYSLQLVNGDPATDAVTAQYIWQNYRSQLDHLAIGNEPDEPYSLYPPYGTGTDPALTNYTSYLADWRKFATAITNVVPEVTFVAPDTGGLGWNTSFANDEKNSGLVALFTTHDYFGGKYQSQTSATAVSNILSARWVSSLYPQELNGMSQVVADGYPFRLTELNDYLGGVTNASDAFAAALWALDVMHWWAAHGAAGVNFHNNQWIRTDTIYLDENNGSFQIHPKAYGILAFNLGGHGSVEPATMSNPDGLNLTAYAVADATNLYVTLINKEYGAGARNAAVTLSLNGFSPGAVAVMHLSVSGGNVEATNGVTLGGAFITNNAPWQGRWTTLGSITNGQFTVFVPAASAAVVKLAVNPGLPVITQNLPPEVLIVAGWSYTYSIKAQSIGSDNASLLHYQWFNGSTPLAGQTNATYTLTAGDSGSSTYSVVITNAYGAVTSLVSTVTIIPPSANSYAAQVLSQNPSGYWPLQETNPPAAATMETNYGSLGALGDAYYAATAPSQVLLGAGGALTSSGDNDAAAYFPGGGTGYLFVPRVSPALTIKPPFTLECWFNSTSTSFGDLIGEGGSGLNSPVNTGNAGGVRLAYGGGMSGGPDLQLYIFTGSGQTRPSLQLPANTLPLGQWNYCVATFNGITAYLYVNGVQEGSKTFTMATDEWSPLTIGAGFWRGYASSWIVGTMDEVAIYTNVLTPSQISAHYRAATTPGSNYMQAVLSDHPLLYYRMDLPAYTNVPAAFCPVAANYGTAPVNGAYRSQTRPGAVTGPPIVTPRGQVASPINGLIACIDAGYDAAFDPTGTQPFTALCWFKGNPADGRVQALMSQGTDWALNLVGTNGTVALVDGAGSVASTNVLNDGKWHFVAGVYDGIRNSLYVDGMLNNATPAFGSLTGDPGANLYLGGNAAFTSGQGQQYFAGDIAQAAFLTNALTASAIQQIYRTAVTVTVNPNPTNIVASVTGNELTLSWPADHTGWQLQAQTNNLGAGLGTNWVDVAGSTNVDQMVIPIRTANGSVFYRLVYP